MDNESTLMSKTQEELVHIILRKDIVEVKLTNELNSVKDYNLEVERKLDEALYANGEYQIKTAELTKDLTDKQIENELIQKRIKRWRTISVVSWAVTLVGLLYFAFFA